MNNQKDMLHARVVYYFPKANEDTQLDPDSDHVKARVSLLLGIDIVTLVRFSNGAPIEGQIRHKELADAGASYWTWPDGVNEPDKFQ